MLVELFKLQKQMSKDTFIFLNQVPKYKITQYARWPNQEQNIVLLENLMG